LADKSAIQVTRAGDELIIHVGNQKRTQLLPRALLALEIKSAQYADNFLSIVFGNGQGRSAVKESDERK